MNRAPARIASRALALVAALVALVGCGGDSGVGGGVGCFDTADGLCDAFIGVEASVLTQIQQQCSGTFGSCPANAVGGCTFAITVTRPNGTSYPATRSRSYYPPLWSAASARQDCLTDHGTPR